MLPVLIAVSLGVMSLATVGENIRRHREAAFDIIGLAVRTNNAREASADALIGKQWQRLYRDGLLAKIPNKADTAVVALYTDYSSDEHGDYTYILGARVTSCATLPEGMVCRHVPAADYVTLESEPGAIPGIVIALWQRVWNLSPAQLSGTRSFKNDYELYDSRAADPQNATVELHLGLTASGESPSR